MRIGGVYVDLGSIIVGYLFDYAAVDKFMDKVGAGPDYDDKLNKIADKLDNVP